MGEIDWSKFRDYDNLPKGCRWTFDCTRTCDGHEVCFWCDEWDEDPPSDFLCEEDEYDDDWDDDWEDWEEDDDWDELEEM